VVASFNSRSRPEKSPSLPDKVSAIHHALREAKIPHAIGGALALAYYAEPRATIDVDINVFVSTERWPEICETLAPLGINVEVEVKDEAYWRYNRVLDERNANKVWSDPRAHNYYWTEHGRSSVMNPFYSAEMSGFLRKPDLSDLEIS